MTELFTIGYERAPQHALLETLLANGIETLVDIRELPLSRKPGFSKTALGEAVRAHGMQYIHVRALGTPRDIRYQRKTDHDEAAFRAGFLSYLDTQDAAMDALMARIPQERCCLLCYEADYRECHRLMVAERAVERSGEQVVAVHLGIPAGN